MPWINGEPPRDGKPYVCETPSYAKPLFLRWLRYNGAEMWRDWDNDGHLTVTRWHPLGGDESIFARLRSALKPLADQPLTTEPGHNRTRLFSWDDHDEKIRAARAALSNK